MYFTNFPIIDYNNKSIRDISRNVRLKNDVTKNISLFYPYEVSSGMRADMLAYTYYDDAYYDWLIYLTNGIVDPYYGWYLSENDFSEFIQKKYGSFEAAVEKIDHWALNWADIDEEITVSFYTNNLPNALKKYYTPRIGYSNRIISYMRAPAEWTVNTNRILTIGATVTGTFTAGDIVTFSSNGQGTVVTANSSVLTLQHISGNVTAPSLATANNGASANVASVTVSIQNINVSEEIYWKPVTSFEKEMEINEARKIIYLVDANYAVDASEEIRKMLKT